MYSPDYSSEELFFAHDILWPKLYDFVHGAVGDSHIFSFCRRKCLWLNLYFALRTWLFASFRFIFVSVQLNICMKRVCCIRTFIIPLVIIFMFTLSFKVRENNINTSVHQKHSFYEPEITLYSL